MGGVGGSGWSGCPRWKIPVHPPQGLTAHSGCGTIRSMDAVTTTKTRAKRTRSKKSDDALLSVAVTKEALPQWFHPFQS